MSRDINAAIMDGRMSARSGASIIDIPRSYGKDCAEAWVQGYEVEAETVRMGGFDPNQARDEDGRWSDATVVQDIDRPDVNGTAPKMAPVRDRIDVALSGIVPVLRVSTDDNIMSSVSVRGSLDPRDEWANGIEENSRHFRFSIVPQKGARYYTEGDDKVTVELATVHGKLGRAKKFRKRTTTIDKAINSIKDWLAFVKSEFDPNNPDIRMSSLRMSPEDVRMSGFDPNQARDEDGRWSDARQKVNEGNKRTEEIEKAIRFIKKQPHSANLTLSQMDQRLRGEWHNAASLRDAFADDDKSYHKAIVTHLRDQLFGEGSGGGEDHGSTELEDKILNAISQMSNPTLSEIAEKIGVPAGKGSNPLESPLNRALVSLRDTGFVKVSDNRFGEPRFRRDYRGPFGSATDEEGIVHLLKLEAKQLFRDEVSGEEEFYKEHDYEITKGTTIGDVVDGLSGLIFDLGKADAKTSVATGDLARKISILEDQATTAAVELEKNMKSP